MKFKVKERDREKRVDHFLVEKTGEYSRTQIQKMIKEGWVSINNQKVKANVTLKLNDNIYLKIPKNISNPNIKAKKIPLNITYEDAHLLVVNKPSGMLTHPTKYKEDDTLVNALLSYTQLSSGSDLIRPGIIHRLDKETSGLLLVAKNDQVHKALAKLIEKRQVKKTYITLTAGKLTPKSGTIEAPILKTRGSKNEGKSVVSPNEKAKMSITHYQVLEYIAHKYTLLEVDLETGRTHQIRVHLQAISHPIIGDKLYGQKKVNDHFEKLGLNRQFLHAKELEFTHPISKKKLRVTSDLPNDLQSILTQLT
jgi:23S rRNA pseudouridine1911/1915/1917 synthase